MDWAVNIQKSTKPSRHHIMHIVLSIKQANTTSGMIRETMVTGDEDTLLSLCKSLVRPQLEYSMESILEPLNKNRRMCFPSLCLCVCPSICLSVDMSFYPYVCVCLFLSVILPVCMSVCVSVCVCLLVCSSVCLSVSVSVGLYVCLSVYLFVRLYVYPSVSLRLSVGLLYFYISVRACVCPCMYVRLHKYMSVSVCWSVVCMSVRVCLLVCLSVCLSVCPHRTYRGIEIPSNYMHGNSPGSHAVC